MIHFRLCMVYCVTFFTVSAICECFYDGKTFQCSGNLEKINTSDISTLNLSNRGLTELPSDILAVYQHITHLNASSNLLRRIEDRSLLSRLPNLQHLDLTNNSLIHINLKLFAKNPLLRILILDGNPHMFLSPSAAKLPNLEELHLENCGLETLHSGTFQGLTGLKVLNLRWNTIMKLSGGLSSVSVIMLKGNPMVGERIVDEVVNSWRHYVFGLLPEDKDLLLVQIGFFIIAGVVMVVRCIFCT